MLILIKDIHSEPRVYEGEEPASILDVKPSSSDVPVKVEEPIRYRLRAYLAADQLVVEGEIRAKADFLCVRCAESFSREVVDPAFQRLFPVPDKSESVDLTADIRETILLNFPPYPVCREQCKGLCGQCGSNLNRKTCTCRPPADFRWNELESLKMPRPKAHRRK